MLYVPLTLTLSQKGEGTVRALFRAASAILFNG